MAKVSVPLISAVIALAIATPASGKGLWVDRVMIDGAGLEQPRVFEAPPPPHGRGVMPWALLGTSWGQRGWASTRPDVVLGPGYKVKIQVAGLEELEPRSYALVVYPFAEGEPRAYIPSYKREIGQNEWVPMVGGWSRLPKSFKSWFGDHVVPAPPARVAHAHPLIPLGFAFVVIVLVVMTRHRLQHRVRPRAA